MNKPENLIPSAYEQLVERYRAGGAPFHISTRPYYSTGAFKFERDQAVAAIAGATRVVLKASAGQELKFFSYGIGENVLGVQLGDRAATEADTNLAEAQETNDEDFAIEGLSATAHAARCDYTGAGPFTGDFGTGMADGSIVVEDPASILVPPELGSPLVLEKLLFEAIKSHVSLATSWNRKAGDHLGTLDQIPEGGAKSYLRANGEPTHHNFFRMPEGQKWCREGSPADTKFQLVARLERDVYVIVAEPGLITTGETPIGNLQNVYLDWKVRLHGHAFYLPSQNV